MQVRSVTDDELDDNKIDFDLLTRRQRDSARGSDDGPSRTPSSDSTSARVSDDSSSRASEIWPLHLTPKFIDQYITGDSIGSGSYAEVRECVDTQTLERCALKIINKEYLVRQAPRALANQMQEIRILRHFQHCNIIRMRQCLQKGSYIYIALEYCSFNLNDLLTGQPEGKFPLVIGRRFFHQLCYGLKYLHSLGIVHRDIKPDNLLLTNSGTLKIIDFGVSHILSMWSRDDWCSNYEGTPLFQAPEVISGQIEYLGTKVDVWSCGVTLFLVLFGTYPFIDEALLGLCDKILGQELQVPRIEPASLALTDLLACMLDKNARRRASIEQVLAHPWLKLCHANQHDSDDAEYEEFFDYITEAQKQQQQQQQQQQQSSGSKDVYRSMTVLPYLYRHHFPNLPIRKSAQSRDISPVSSHRPTASHRLERLHSMSPDERAPEGKSRRSSSSEPNHSSDEISSQSSRTDGSTSDESSTLSSPPSARSDGYFHETRVNSTDNPADQIEWGTEEQYQLMKVPQVRANRVRPLTTGRRQRRRWRHGRRERARRTRRDDNKHITHEASERPPS